VRPAAPKAPADPKLRAAIDHIAVCIARAVVRDLAAEDREEHALDLGTPIDAELQFDLHHTPPSRLVGSDAWNGSNLERRLGWYIDLVNAALKSPLEVVSSARRPHMLGR